MKTLSVILKNLSILILRLSRKFNPHYDYLLISTDEIIYSDPEYCATISILSSEEQLSEILNNKMLSDGQDMLVENIINTQDKLNDNKLIRASEVYNVR